MKIFVDTKKAVDMNHHESFMIHDVMHGAPATEPRSRFVTTVPSSSMVRTLAHAEQVARKNYVDICPYQEHASSRIMRQ